MIQTVLLSDCKRITYKVIEGYRKRGEKITLIDDDYEKVTGEIF